MSKKTGRMLAFFLFGVNLFSVYKGEILASELEKEEITAVSVNAVSDNQPEQQKEKPDSDTASQEKNTEQDMGVISVALPQEFDLKIDPLYLETEDVDLQISSPVYEIVNYGTQAVEVLVQPQVVSDGFLFCDAPPAAGEDLESDASGKALYLCMQLESPAADGEAGSFSAGAVLSKQKPDSFTVRLEGAGEDGKITDSCKARFRFAGNVDPHAEYKNGELKITATFTIHSL